MRPVKGHLIAGNSWIGRHDGRATRGRSIDDDEWITPAVHPHNQVCSLSKHAHGTLAVTAQAICPNFGSSTCCVWINFVDPGTSRVVVETSIDDPNLRAN